MFDALAHLQTFADRGDLRELIAALAGLWRQHRSPELAQVLSLISAAYLDGKTPPTDKKTWHALAVAHHPADLPLLSAHVFDDLSHNAPRVKYLRGWPPDPRIADQLHQKISSEPALNGTGRTVWKQLVEWLVSLGDPRSYDALGEALESVRLDISHSRRLHHGRDALEKVPQPKPLDGATLAALDRLLSTAVPGARRPALDPWRARERRMLDAIYDAPDDDSLRHVYADALEERGDAFGRFIRVQLHGNRDAWEPLADTPQRSGTFPMLRRYFKLGWSRGFPSTANVSRHASYAQVCTDKSLRLIHTLNFAPEHTAPNSTVRGLGLFVSPWLDRLRIVLGVREPILRELLSSQWGPGFRWLGLYGFAGIAQLLPQLRLSPDCVVSVANLPGPEIEAVLKLKLTAQLTLPAETLPHGTSDAWRARANELSSQVQLLTSSETRARLQALQPQ